MREIVSVPYSEIRNQKCYRYGGDEFLVVVKNEDAQGVALA